MNIKNVWWVVRVWKGELYFVEFTFLFQGKALVFGMIKKRNLGFGAYVCLAREVLLLIKATNKKREKKSECVQV